MTKEQFQQWAMAVVLHVEQGKEESAQFVGQVEEHDKEAAALLRSSLQAGRRWPTTSGPGWTTGPRAEL